MCGGNCRNSNSTMDPPVDGTPFRPKEAQLGPSEESMVTTMMKLQEQLDRLQVKITEKGDDVASKKTGSDRIRIRIRNTGWHYGCWCDCISRTCATISIFSAKMALLTMKSVSFLASLLLTVLRVF